MYAGKEFDLGGTKFTVPALSLAELRNGAMAKIKEHDGLIKQMADDPSKFYEAMIVRGEIIALAIKRNYPQLDAEKLLESLDMGNTNEIWMHILGASGLKVGEATAEPKPATAAPPTPGT